VRSVAGQRRDHLVRVHVRRGARPGLEDVDRELVVVLSGGNGVGGGRDLLGDVRVEQPELGVGAGGGALDPAEPVDHGHRDRLAGHREVGDRLPRLGTPQLGHLGSFVSAHRFVSGA